MNLQLVTCDGEVYLAPTVKEWRLRRTGGVPCDDLEAVCLFDGKLMDVLPRVYRFAAYQGDTLVLRGVVDEYRAEVSGKGRLLTISGRGMAALLLDNEAEAVEYQGATVEEILRNHAAPWGISWGTCQDLRCAGVYRVESGSSQWEALSGFVRYVGGFLPWFTEEGVLQVCPLAGSGVHRSIDSTSAVTDCSVRSTRYGVISEMMVKDKSRRTSQRVVNQPFLDLGGSRRQVLYTPGVSTLAAMRYTGEYQIRRSMEGTRQVELTVAGAFAAQPGDVVWVTYPPLGLAGGYHVAEAESRGGSAGETTTLTLEERDHVDF